MYTPRFSFTQEIIGLLGRIEFVRGKLKDKKLPLHISSDLKQRARLKSTHYSTAIEGNPLTFREVEGLIKKRPEATEDRYAQEVRNYWRAMAFLRVSKAMKITVSEDFIKRLHRIIEVRGPGRRGKQSEYRGQTPPGILFCIRDSVTGEIDYIPPAYDDVPVLMTGLVHWIDKAVDIPVPVKAAIAAYQLLTIHPFSDGNGRLARALSLYILMVGDYDLNGYFSIEEYYFKDIQAYYGNLQMGLPVEYYQGRNNADTTPWITYFLKTMTEAFENIASSADRLHEATGGKLLELSRKEIKLLELALRFEGKPLSLETMANWFGVTKRTMQEWVKEWLTIQLLEPASGKQRITSYVLGVKYRELKFEDIF
ncbi:filamentation induced by cAMP protein Fic [Desulfocucumis palustris]|uniref:Filamentation induced by cAMP protein Fic n=1 Tax=Desulfocucumis palustris TaxID=1898651 RepID=A0A2L2XDK2_9FIRM|nr:Fic family protein [Desulfocucumis palustris]GBF34104.1 filamentation induced by cAMP protein Fic [Desulfocucumis palustris]